MQWTDQIRMVAIAQIADKCYQRESPQSPYRALKAIQMLCGNSERVLDAPAQHLTLETLGVDFSSLERLSKRLEERAKADQLDQVLRRLE